MCIKTLWVACVVCCVGWLQGCVSTEAPSARPASAAQQAEANLNLGTAYLRQGRADLAIEKLERALEQDPRLATAHSTIALAYDQLGDFERAEQHYRRATQLDPADASAANSYAVFLCRRGRWSDAEPFFRRAANNPRYATPAVALTNAGVCAREAGASEAAEQNFRAALDRDPVFADALFNMIDLSYASGNYMQSRAFIQRYLDAHTANPGVLWLCFNVEQQLGDPDRARQCARRLRDEFPASPEFAQLRQIQTNDGP